MQVPLTDEGGVIRTAISPSYVSSWGIVECLRELLQEAVDLSTAGCRIRVSHTGRCAIIEDWGPGLKREHLALGRSEKRDQAQLIGQFGEGFKLAALVAARMGRGMLIETVGFSARPYIAVDPGLQCETLMFALGPSTRKIGTKVTVEASRPEFEEAKSRFLRWRKGVRKNAAVFLPGGQVYINGALAAVDAELLFSYSFRCEKGAKEAQNRDRTIVDGSYLRERVEAALENLGNATLIEALLSAMVNRFECLETGIYLAPRTRVLRAWRKAAARVVGPRDRTVLSSDPAHDIEASSLGFAVRRGDDYYLRNLLNHLGYRESRDVSKARIKKPVQGSLTADEKKALRDAIALVTRAYKMPGKVKVTEATDLSLDQSDVKGLYDRLSDTIWLSRSLLTNSRELVRTLLHETAHKYSGAADCTRRFEEELAGIAADLVFRFCANEKNVVETKGPKVWNNSIQVA